MGGSRAVEGRFVLQPCPGAGNDSPGSGAGLGPGVWPGAGAGDDGLGTGADLGPGAWLGGDMERLMVE